MSEMNRVIIRIGREKLLLLASIVLSLTMPLGHLSAEVPKSADSGEAPANSPMETEGLDPKLERILTRYYEKTFTSLENWTSVQSVLFKGALDLPQGRFDFTAHKKKPDYYKVVVHRALGERIIMGYDGNEAWQLNSTQPNNGPSAMPEAEAQNFIRDATIGGHLLNPLMPGKRIEFNGIVKVDGRDCFELEVTLPDGQSIRSAIDIVTYAERRQVTVNNVNGQEESNTYRDFRVVDGVRFPFASIMESGGKVMHRVEMSEIRVNAGLIPAMFQPPSEIQSPGSELETPKKPESLIQPKTIAPSVVPFGESRFGESVFTDPQASEQK